MKLLRLKLHGMNIIQISILLMIIGLFFGVFSANMFRSFYYERMMNNHNVVFTEIVRENIDYSGLFFYILGNNFREFIVFWLLSITILGIPYIVIKIIAFGFSTGFFISAIAMQYGFKGFLLILVYKFPHGIIYLPIIILCLHRGYNLSRSIYYENRDYIGTIIRQLKSYFLLLLFLSILLVLGSFLEAYVGSFLLKKTLGLFT
ncbi:MAG: hypothetical protein EWM47_03115 [Anaerolineaceae bacterium]|nr:MAG: hypothetical protein EWM47_03115 [Anaerolineaceae bacterium]